MTTAMEASQAALTNGDPLRLLAALEGPYAPTKGHQRRPPYWRPPLPSVVWAAHVVDSWAWSRPYEGPKVVLDRTAAWLSAASSVEVAHGELDRTTCEYFTGDPGYYLIQVHPWREGDSLPNPLGHVRKGVTEVWVPAPTVKLLTELERAGRWPDVTILDSYTGDPVRLRGWAEFVRDLRVWTIERFGRDSEQYAELKQSIGMCWSLLLGQDQGIGHKRIWKCKCQRPDWSHAVRALSSATLWRWADAAREVGYPAVALRNIDELVLPVDALIPLTGMSGPRKTRQLRIDPDGIKLGTFKVKALADG